MGDEILWTVIKIHIVIIILCSNYEKIFCDQPYNSGIIGLEKIECVNFSRFVVFGIFLNRQQTGYL